MDAATIRQVHRISLSLDQWETIRQGYLDVQQALATLDPAVRRNHSIELLRHAIHKWEKTFATDDFA
jgi:hypothetical protein